jgi:hypothetical protein
MHLPIGNSAGRFMMVRMIPTRRFAAATLVCLLAAAVSAEEPKWVPLFNGKDLSGWTPKIAKRPLGENFANTFRVEDGILKVSYDGYTTFDEQFGHLFTNLAYSHYILRLEYRFSGTMVADAPKYVNLNSGVMLHAQPPQSMRFDQGFPASLEMQFLADEGKGPRSTANLCTPGTHVEMGGQLVTKHIVKSEMRRSFTVSMASKCCATSARSSIPRTTTLRRPIRSNSAAISCSATATLLCKPKGSRFGFGRSS